MAGDSGKKKRGAKVFGSLERGLDKMINMLTPSKKRAQRDGPRKIRVRSVSWCLRFCPTRPQNLWLFGLQPQYNVTLTSQTNPDQVLNQILSILPEKNIDFTQKG